MNDKVQKKLDILMKRYSKNLPDKIDKIETLWVKQQSEWDPVQFETFHREVHSLCGSAGTYGYSELSKTARQMELFLKPIIKKAIINNQDKELIANYLNQLKLILSIEKPEHDLILESELTSQNENKHIYIMEEDEVLFHQLKNSLEQTGFKPYSIQDMPTLELVVAENAPAAMIIDTDYLDKSGIQSLLNIQKEQNSIIQLFCILPNAELTPRLEAIRAGCHAFFQKPVDIPQLTQIVNHKCGSNQGESYRILIVDDSHSLGEYYSLILNQAGMNTKAITNPLELFKELESFQPNLLLMDVYMPEALDLN